MAEKETKKNPEEVSGVTPSAPPKASGYSGRFLGIVIFIVLILVVFVAWTLKRDADRSAALKAGKAEGKGTQATQLIGGILGANKPQTPEALGQKENSSAPAFIKNMPTQQHSFTDNTTQKKKKIDKELQKRMSAPLLADIQGNCNPMRGEDSCLPHSKHKNKKKDDMNAVFKQTMEKFAAQETAPPPAMPTLSDITKTVHTAMADSQQMQQASASASPVGYGGMGYGGIGGMGGMAMPVMGPTTPPPAKTEAAQEKWAKGNHDSQAFIEVKEKKPKTDYWLRAGHAVPAVLTTEINTDAPGMAKARVSHDIYNDAPGHENEILVPQGSYLIGKYSNSVAVGQTRVQIVWTEVQLPTGEVFNINGEGHSLTGEAGFHDKVNNHYLRMFEGVALMSLFDAGPMLATPGSNTSQLSGGAVASTMGQSVGMNASSLGMEFTSNMLNMQPTLKIRQGYAFTIFIPSTLVFPKYYSYVGENK